MRCNGDFVSFLHFIVHDHVHARGFSSLFSLIFRFHLIIGTVCADFAVSANKSIHFSFTRKDIHRKIARFISFSFDGINVCYRKQSKCIMEMLYISCILTSTSFSTHMKMVKKNSITLSIKNSLGSFIFD